MSIIGLYNNAELSLASYANLTVSLGTGQQKSALQLAGMSQVQAEQFAARYPEIVAVYPTDAEGFAATVFNAPGFKDTTENQNFLNNLVPGAVVPNGSGVVQVVGDGSSIGLAA